MDRLYVRVLGVKNKFSQTKHRQTHKKKKTPCGLTFDKDNPMLLFPKRCLHFGSIAGFISLFVFSFSTATLDHPQFSNMPAFYPKVFTHKMR